MKFPCPLCLVALVGLIAGCPKPAIEMVPDHDILVAADGSGGYASVQAAVNAARAGDLIYVKAGVYREQVKVERTAGIRLVGAGPDRAVIDAGGEYAALTLGADDCRVEGFTLRNASSHGLYVKSSGNVVRRCLLAGNGDRGIYFSSFGGDPSARVEHCTVADNAVSAVYVPAGDERTEITDCILAFNGRALVTDDDEDGGMRLEFNCVFEPGGAAGPAARSGTGITADPGFVDREQGNYRLRPGSPCVGAARDGGNIGCF